MPLHLVEDMGSLDVQQESEHELESTSSSVSGPQAAFQQGNPQSKVTVALSPFLIPVNFSFIPLTQKHTAKRILGNVVQLSPVDKIQTTTDKYNSV